MEEKFTIYDFAFDCSQKLIELGYEDRQELPMSLIYETSHKLFDAGLNVMLYRTKSNKTVTLFVDSGRFQTR